MYFISILGRYIISNTNAIIAAIIVIIDNWLMDLNSENNRGNKVNIITIDVLITAL